MGDDGSSTFVEGVWYILGLAEEGSDFYIFLGCFFKGIVILEVGRIWLTLWSEVMVWEEWADLVYYD